MIYTFALIKRLHRNVPSDSERDQNDDIEKVKINTVEEYNW